MSHLVGIGQGIPRQGTHGERTAFDIHHPELHPIYIIGTRIRHLPHLFPHFLRLHPHRQQENEEQDESLRP